MAGGKNPRCQRKQKGEPGICTSSSTFRNQSTNPVLVHSQVPILPHYFKLKFKLILNINFKNHQIDFSVFKKLASLRSV